MVAKSSNLADAFVAPPPSLLGGRTRVLRFTWQDHQALIRMGFVPENASTELLDGMIVHKDRSAVGQDPMSIGPNHRKCVERLSSLRKRIDDERRHVESQQPLLCEDFQTPEPDFMVLRGTLDDYAGLPTAADAICVVEVADSSYETDAGEKVAIYAQGGVRQYVIINLRNRTAEVYSGPDTVTRRYSDRLIVAEDEELTLRVGESDLFRVRLSELLA